MKRSITILIPRLNGPGEGQVGGGEQVTENLYRALWKKGLCVDLAVFKAGNSPFHLPSGVRLIDFASNQPFGAANLIGNVIPRLVRHLRRDRPYVLLAVDHYAGLAALVARMIACVPVSVVVAVHGTLSHKMANSGVVGLRCCSVRVLRWIYGHADKIIAVSRGASRDLIDISGIDPRNVQVIYNPVVCANLFTLAEEPVMNDWFGELVRSEGPIVLGVGRLTKAKDFSTLIRAFGIVLKQRTAHLVILGEGEDRAKLESLVQELGLAGAITMPGFEKNPYAYMRRSDVFALSSAWEGLPTVLIEAMACGMRVVSTDCPNGPAEILDEGRWGSLVPVGDARAMAEALLKAFDGTRKELPREAWMPFTEERAVQEYIRVLAAEALDK